MCSDVCLSAIRKIPSSWLGRRRRVMGPLRRSAPALHASAFPQFCGSWASRAGSGRCGFPLAVPAPCSVDSVLSHPRPSSGSALTLLGKLSLRLAPLAPSLWFPSEPRNLPVRAVSVACMWCRSCIVRICPHVFSRGRFRSLRAGAVPHHGAVFKLGTQRVPEAKQLVPENIPGLEAAELDTDLSLCDSRACSSHAQSPLHAWVPVGETAVSAALGSSISSRGWHFVLFLPLPATGRSFSLACSSAGSSCLTGVFWLHRTQAHDNGS